jgi:hypothetical protein
MLPSHRSSVETNSGSGTCVGCLRSTAARTAVTAVGGLSSDPSSGSWPGPTVSTATSDPGPISMPRRNRLASWSVRQIMRMETGLRWSSKARDMYPGNRKYLSSLQLFWISQMTSSSEPSLNLSRTTPSALRSVGPGDPTEPVRVSAATHVAPRLPPARPSSHATESGSSWTSFTRISWNSPGIDSSFQIGGFTRKNEAFARRSRLRRIADSRCGARGAAPTESGRPR